MHPINVDTKLGLWAIALAVILTSGSLGYLAIAKPRVEFNLIQEEGMGATESSNDILIGVLFEVTEMVGATPAYEIELDDFSFLINGQNGSYECSYVFEENTCQILPEECVNPNNFTPSNLQLKQGICFPGIMPSITDGPFVIVENNINICESTCTIQLDTDTGNIVNSQTTSIQSSITILDSDNDECSDFQDYFPLDASECFDSDYDGVGDNADAFPHDANETLDSDLDGIGDNSDWWDEGDGSLRIHVSRLYAWDRDYNEYYDEWSDWQENSVMPEWIVVIIIDIDCNGIDDSGLVWGTEEDPALMNTKSVSGMDYDSTYGIDLNINDTKEKICISAGALDADKETCGFFFTSTCYDQDVLDTWNGEGNIGYYEIDLSLTSGTESLHYRGDDSDSNQMDAHIEIKYLPHSVN